MHISADKTALAEHAEIWHEVRDDLSKRTITKRSADQADNRLRIATIWIRKGKPSNSKTLRIAWIRTTLASRQHNMQQTEIDSKA